MSFFGKVFKFQSANNLDDFLISLGLPAETLSDFKNFTPDQKIEKSGDTYTYTISTTRGDKRLSFASGSEFEDQGRNMLIKNTFTVNDNCVTHVMKLEPGVIITSNKQFSPMKMVEELTNSNWNGVACITYSA